jgi:hypothetical protein
MRISEDNEIIKNKDTSAMNCVRYLFRKYCIDHIDELLWHLHDAEIEGEMEELPSHEEKFGFNFQDECKCTSIKMRECCANLDKCFEEKVRRDLIKCPL